MRYCTTTFSLAARETSGRLRPAQPRQRPLAPPSTESPPIGVAGRAGRSEDMDLFTWRQRPRAPRSGPGPGPGPGPKPTHGRQARALVTALALTLALGVAPGLAAPTGTPPTPEDPASPTPSWADSDGEMATGVPPSINGSQSDSFSKYRVCAAAATGELFRFPMEQTCPQAEAHEHEMGVLLVFKSNIVPHLFRVRKYQKLVTSTTVYRGTYDVSITNQYTLKLPVPMYEIWRIDRMYECFSAAMVTLNGQLHTFYDRDGTNRSAYMRPADGMTDSVRRYQTQPTIYAEPSATLWLYRTRTTVNCMVTDMEARSVPPFDYFITATGDSVEMSPFWGSVKAGKAHNNSSGAGGAKGGTRSLGAPVWETGAGETLHENIKDVHVEDDYKIIAYDNLGQLPAGHRRIFVDKGEYVLSWQAQTRQESYCPLTLWRDFRNGIRVRTETSFHFVANDVTASFATPTTQDVPLPSSNPCTERVINRTVEERLAQLAKTHVRNGSNEYYSTMGGLHLVWVPLAPVELSEAHARLQEAAGNVSAPAPTQTTVRARRRRDVGHSPPVQDTIESSLETAQLQFAYDSLRERINHILEDLAHTWCREQQRATQMWYHLSKINPTSVMSVLYGRPVSARQVGDVISVTQCVDVAQDSVTLHGSLRTPDKNVCYSRPRVSFRFVNGSTVFTGQLGPRNEILLTTSHVEPCAERAEHYFQAGDQMHVYRDYLHVAVLPLANVTTLDTFIAMNLSFIENIDFQVVELYTREEKKLSNVMDIETMFREYNYYTHKLSGLRKDLDSTIDNNRDAFIDALGGIMEDLGNIGRVVVNVASTVVGFFGSVVTGVLNFIRNPFGGMLMIALVVGVVMLVFCLRQRTTQMFTAPVRMLYPGVDEAAKKSNISPIGDAQLKSILLAMHNFQQGEHQKQVAAEAARHGPIGAAYATMRDTVRRRWGGYRPLKNEEDGESGGDLESEGPGRDGPETGTALHAGDSAGDSSGYEVNGSGDKPTAQQRLSRLTSKITRGSKQAYRKLSRSRSPPPSYKDTVV
nr:envelope glycoprotein B [Eptesicus fuscus gammaherpesvirus]